MNLGSLGGRRSVSPTSSRTSSPVPRIARQTAEDDVIKSDKNLRRYATIVERALSTWETAPEEWADYIAFLSRLLRAIQACGKDVTALPYTSDIASKLAQCLNPALPSGVHQKALEVYAYIFATFGREYVSDHLHAFLPGLSGVLSFASLSTRPGLYELLQEYVVRLDPTDLRPVMKSLVLSILPALEDETSEDFEQALSILSKLESAFFATNHESDQPLEFAGYFWQCLFLAIITSPSRRQGGLNYITRRLPNFGALKSSQNENGEGTTDLSFTAEAALLPESGLLIRAFACGLMDTQPLIQRGFLDLLVTHLPLSSPVLQERVGKLDFDRLTTAAVSVLLRRDMSLNRRVWSWLLGPEPKDAANFSPSAERSESLQGEDSQQYRHFTQYGQSSVERCLTAMLEQRNVRPVEKARPFRICLSLMDRWEIGGVLVPRLFLSAMRSVYTYSIEATREDAAEAIRSASLFFDGTESRLIWSELFKLIRAETEDSPGSPDELHFFRWIVQNFNVREEEMVVLHIPLVAAFLLDVIKTPSSITSEKLLSLSNCAMALVEFIPARAFSPTNKVDEATSAAGSAFDIRRATKHYYEGQGTVGRTTLPSQVQLTEVVVRATFSALGEHMVHRPEIFVQTVQIAISLLAKIPKHQSIPVTEVLQSLRTNIEQTTDHVIQYSTISSTIALLSAMSSHGAHSTSASQDLQSLEITLLGQLWCYLSPTRAKHHVEAVRLIWQLDDLAKSGDIVKAGINDLMRSSSTGKSPNDLERAENVYRFTTLWIHTLPLQPVGSKPEARGLVRRGSAATASDAALWPRRQDILSGPLLLCLDILCDSTEGSKSVVRNMLAYPNSISLALQILLTRMATVLDVKNGPARPHEQTAERGRQQRCRELKYVLGHVLGVLSLDEEMMWQGLGELDLAKVTGFNDGDAVTWLATQSIQLLGNSTFSPELSEHAACILRKLLNGPFPIKLRLRSLALEDLLLGKVRASLSLPDKASQTSLLELAVLAMSLGQMQNQGPETDAHRRRFSLNSGRRSSAAPREEQTPVQDNAPYKPPSQLLETLREGFTNPSSRLQMDAWLDFLAAGITFFGEMLLTNLIPLVDTFCGQLRQCFDELVAISDKASDSRAFSPDSTILKLLEGLNMLLAEAHDQVSAEDETEPQRKASESSQSVLGSMASSAFKSQAAPPPSRTAKANSRLTVILAFQDAIRMCVKIWMWSAGGPENEVSNRFNAATTSYYTHRLRNRTRSMLEQVFTAEPLESLEVVMSLWSQASGPQESSAILSLLHVLTVSRPKSVVPAVLDALCSRTNTSHMSPSRQSSLTSDLSAADVVAFLTAYLETVEDDATDEIWPDCTAFMRDVLSNPLPFRQILPALLWVTLILAQKLDNTNFGDQRKMRRELGDQFSRLLSATFAASPNSFHSDLNGHAGGNPSETELSTGRRNMDVVVILKHVVAKIESILDSVDRITSVVNTLSTSLISPAFHAKSFPGTVTADVLALLARMTKKAPTAKSWRREVNDAFNNPRILESSATLTEQYWFPVLQQWSQGDKERVHELLSRLAPPSSAGIMFGVGAAAARLKADGETQFIIRRLCLLLLASPNDSYAAHMQLMQEKLVELFQASASSSPSSTIKAELFMLCRALMLSTSPVNVAPLWPIINDQLQNALASLAPRDARQVSFTNISLLQAGKLLDLLVALAPDEFQLYEWLYVTDTTDAVYRPQGWSPTALADQLAEHLGLDSGRDTSPTPTSAAQSGQTRTLFGSELGYDKEDIKAMVLDDFAKTIMRPFLSQLSINAYESTYSMETPELGLYRKSLLEDLLDTSTLVDHER